MNARSPTARDKRKSGSYSFSQAVINILLITAFFVLLKLFNLPTYAKWLILGAVVVFNVGILLFRLKVRN